MDTNQMQGLWSTRPIRPATGRTVAGVCVGVGNRYRVDPTLVKVAFVIAAMFGGSGILVYIAAWLVLPSERRLSGAVSRAATAQWYAGHPHLGYDQWRQSHSHLPLPALDGLSRHGLGRGHVIGLIVLAIIAATSLGPDSTWSSSGLVGVALLAVGWWLLHRRTPTPPPGTSVDTYPQVLAQAMSSAPAATFFPTGPVPPMTPTPPNPMPSTSVPPGSTPPAPMPPTPTPASDDAEPVSMRKTGVDAAAAPPVAPAAGIPTAVAEPVPPSWDPLGAARFAWDLPEPTPRAEVATEERKRRSPITLITVGLAILTATGASAAALAGVDWFSPARIAALALAVLGAGLVIGGLTKTTGKHAPGLVPWAIILIAAVVGLSSASNVSIPSGGVGERVWTPTSETDLDPSYSLGMGTQTLDLTSVTLTKDRSVNVRTGIGEVLIKVPASMAVDSRCTAGVGSVECPTGRSGPKDSPVLHIKAHAGMGEVRLSRE